MKKTVRSALAILMAAALLTGCGSAGSSSKKDKEYKKDKNANKTGFLGQLADTLEDKKEDDKPHKKPIWKDEEQVETTAPLEEEEEIPIEPAVLDVTLKVWAPDMDLIEHGWMETMQEQFAEAHPEYNITWINEICNEGDAGYMVSTDPSAAADVYMFANDQLGALIAAGAISRLGGVYEQQVKCDNSWDMIDTVTHTDGHIYGFPMTSNTWFMYYNKDVFTEQDVESLDTMLTKGKVAFDWGNGWYGGTFFFANGGICFGENGSDAAAGIQFGADNGGYEAALKMVQLAANPNMVDGSSGMGYAGFLDGTVGAYFSGSWDYAYLYEILGDKLGAVQLPMVEIGGEQKQMKAFLGSKAVAMNPHTKYPGLVADFAAYLASVEGQKLRYEMRGVIPAATILLYDPDLQLHDVAIAEMNTVINTSVVQPFIPEMGQYWSPMGQFGGLISQGYINEENYKDQVDQLMESLNFEGL